jgi:hypothetical protein
MKVYGGVDVEIHIFLTSALVRREWSASRPGRFTPWPKSARYPLDRRLVEPRSRSGRRGKVKILTPEGRELRSLCRPARNQTLFRLRSPGSYI